MKQPLSKTSKAQFIALGVGREVFAVPVESVLEILDMQPVFRVPEMPAYMLGLISLRGRSVPVLDLRTKLGLPSIPPTGTTRILLVDVRASAQSLVLGLVVDRVMAALALGAEAIKAPPDATMRWRSVYIQDAGHRYERFAIIYFTKLFSAGEAIAAIIRSFGQDFNT